MWVLVEGFLRGTDRRADGPLGAESSAGSVWGWGRGEKHGGRTENLVPDGALTRCRREVRAGDREDWEVRREQTQ